MKRGAGIDISNYRSRLRFEKNLIIKTEANPWLEVEVSDTTMLNKEQMPVPKK